MSEPIVSLQFAVPAAQAEMIDRIQRERGLGSREDALRLLLDIALEAVTGKGRRFWDKPIVVPDSAEPIAHAGQLAERLRAEGHHGAAERVQHARAHVGHALLEGLREACQTVLTTIEALDPKTQLLAEELRLEVDKRLRRTET